MHARRCLYPFPVVPAKKLDASLGYNGTANNICQGKSNQRMGW